METQGKIKLAIRIFTRLVKLTADSSFTFPGGGVAGRTMEAFIRSFGEMYPGEVNAEKLTDYCICQVYMLSMYSGSLRQRWTPAHSFGGKAIRRFAGNTEGKRYFEDKFLASCGLSRKALAGEFRDRSRHPLSKFINPGYEEATKRRKHNSEAGFYICQLSTLLWNPFSALCGTCRHAVRCEAVTRLRYCELYRIRLEEYNKGKET